MIIRGLLYTLLIIVICGIWYDNSSLSKSDKDITRDSGMNDTITIHHPLMVPKKLFLKHRDTTPYKGNWIDISE